LPLGSREAWDAVILSIRRGKAARADLERCFSTHRGYRVERTQAVDMFPHIDRIENDRAAST
jgi:hypothetical protein